MSDLIQSAQSIRSIFMLFVSFFFWFSASATDTHINNDISISTETYQNVYVGGGRVSVNAKIHGDAVMAGGIVTVNDSILEDLLIAGGAVTINGVIDGDIRIAGGNIALNKNVRGDILVFAGNVYIGQEVFITGDLIILGGTITIDGHVEGNLKAAGGNIKLNGSVVGETSITNTGELMINGTLSGPSALSARRITLGPQARFHNDVNYWNEEGYMDFKTKIVAGKAILDPSLAITDNELNWLFILLYLLYALFMILLLQKFFAPQLQLAAGTMRNNMLKSFGAGMLYFTIVPLIVVLLFVTVIGIPMGFLLLTLYGFSIFFSGIITAVLTGNGIDKETGKSSKPKLLLSAFATFIIIKALFFVPLIGWIFSLILTSTAFGAMLLTLKTKKFTKT